ncbi:MAG: host attachment protein [Gammaproteobacteria bacterium]|nr:host attachment protein [Gammaproteobacteria bacterium]
MELTWVVVAESSRARIFVFEGLQSPLREVEDLVNPEARAHERDLKSDRQGRTIDSTGQRRHAKQPEVSPKEQRVIEFAKSVAERVERARAQGMFKRLILVAAPGFLGLLRGSLGDATRQCITREIHKNLVRKDEKAIRKSMKL